MSAPENPPAFATADTYTAHGEGIAQGQSGMSLRDWFAGQALVVLVRDWHPEEGAEAAYLYADAMLAERAKEPKA